MSLGDDIWIGGTGQVQLIIVTYTQTHSQMMDTPLQLIC